MPLREMHQLNAVGKGISIDYRDAEKEIYMGFEVVAAETVKKVKKGVLPAFSQGGNYVEKTASKEFPGCTEYVADPGEVSLVDRGSLPNALIDTMKANTFALHKRDGSIELVRADLGDAPKAAISEADAELIAAALRKSLEDKPLAKEEKTKRKGGKDLHASDFAYVGDPDDTSTWKLPIHDAAHVRNALARFNQTQGIPDGEKPKVKAKIKAAAKKFGIEVSDEASKILKAIDYMKAVTTNQPLRKDLYDVATMAQICDTLQWLHSGACWEREMEEDASTMPEDLETLLHDAISCLVGMVDEETSELAERAAALSSKGATKAMTQDELNKAAADLLAKAKGAHAHLEALHQHLGKMGDQHVAHIKTAKSHVAKCMKALGVEGADAHESDISDGEATPTTITTTSTGDAGHQVKAMLDEFRKSILADLEKKQDETMTAVLTAMFSDGSAPAAIGKADGVGDRSLVPGRGPVQTQAVGKTTDSNNGGPGGPTTATEPEKITPELVRKAYEDRDPQAILKLARLRKTMTGEQMNETNENISMVSSLRK